MTARKLLNLLPSRRRRLERELDRELRYHLERRVLDLKQAGLGDAEARRRAALELGGVVQVQEEVRETWVWRRLDDLQRDVRYGVRTLVRSPGFAATALLSLAIGIGVNAAMFLFAFLASAATGALCGIAPALQRGRIPLITSLKERSPFAAGAACGCGRRSSSARWLSRWCCWWGRGCSSRRWRICTARSHSPAAGC
jgi:hypothetical protein